MNLHFACRPPSHPSHEVRVRRRSLRASLLVGVGATLFGMPTLAHAEDAGSAVAAAVSSDSGGAGDIVVTAQRRKESIQNVGIAITALSGEQLSAIGVNDSTNIAAQVPALQFDSGSGGGVNAFVTIRGVSQVDYSEHQEAPNAVYLDDVYVPTPSMVGFPVYDMARVEALRGPQGTLFGRNSTGGLLHFVTTDPTDTWNGFVNGEYSSYSTFRGEAAVGGPIAQGLDFRLAGFVKEGNGWFTNHNAGEKPTFESRVFGIRGKLGADLGGGWKALLTASLNKSPKHREGAYKAYPAYVDANGVTQYVPDNVDVYGTGAGNDPYGYRDSDTKGTVGSYNDVGRLAKQTYYGTLKIEGPVGAATLTSISNFTKSKIDYNEDADSTPNTVFGYGNGGHTRQFSEELRLSGDMGRLNWTVGGYFLDLDGSYYTDFTIYGSFDAINRYSQHTQSYAVFGQGEYALTDKLKLTLGARVTHDYKKFSSAVYTGPQDPTYDASVTTPFWLFNEATFGKLATMKHGDWAGKAELSYEPMPGALLYASVSRGIRGGGFNATSDGSLAYGDVRFKNETVIAYEAGAKVRMFNGDANLRLSGYYYDYSNYQAFNFNGLITTVSNNDAYFTGGEAEFFATPIKSLTINLGAAYLDAQVKGVSTANGLQNVRPVKAPRWTLNGLVAKTFDVGDYQFRLQYDFDYQSDSKANLVPSPVTDLPASWMQNARISFSHEDAGWEVYAFCNNLANADRRTFAYDNSWTGISLASYALPRWFGAGFRKTF